ncbi:hypothetical protein [Herminiimonas aquatilis]|uniref:Uncharacterized protein n=1 Tax=Herminiimonas aquatilis TaxID=345342 RepID=A0ABW2J5A7_9BURK
MTFFVPSAPDRDAFLFAATAIALGATAVTFLIGCAVTAVTLTAAFALTAGLATGCRLFATAVFFAATFGDFTALFVGAFFTTLATDLTAGFAAVFAAVTLPAGLERAGVTAFFAAIFFVLFADFVTVAFIVPCLSMNFPTLGSYRALRAIHTPSHRPGRSILSSKLG